MIKTGTREEKKLQSYILIVTNKLVNDIQTSFTMCLIHLHVADSSTTLKQTPRE